MLGNILVNVHFNLILACITSIWIIIDFRVEQISCVLFSFLYYRLCHCTICMDECRFALLSTSCTHYHNARPCFYSCPGCISSGRVNLGHFLAVQMCFILHRFYIPPPSLSLSHVPLSCEKWFGTAGAQSKILHWKEMKLVFVRQTRVPAVKVRLELTAGVEYICLRRRVKLYFVWCWPNWC